MMATPRAADGGRGGAEAEDELRGDGGLPDAALV